MSDHPVPPLPTVENTTPPSDAPEDFSPHPALAASLDAAIRAASPSLAASPPPSETPSGGVPPGGRTEEGSAPGAPADSAIRSREEEKREEGGNPEGEDDGVPGNMSLHDHLAELRRRLIRVFLIALGGFLIAYPFGKEIYDLLLIPLLKVLPVSSKLIYTAVPEAFFTYMKTAFIAGLFGTCPLLFYQLWAFIAPGLYKEEKAVLLPLVALSALSFLAGGAFCFFVVLPLAFALFMSFTTDTVQAMPTLHEYLSFVLHLIVPFGLIFEMPLVTFFLARLGLVSAALLRRIRRYAFLIIFIAAAVLTPPDVFSQLLMAGPMLVLYEASILIAAVFGRQKDVSKAPETEIGDPSASRQTPP